jgi:hypothetical protein
MLGDLFSPSARTVRDEDLDKEKIHQWQAQDPFRAMAHTSYSGGTLAGEGLARVGVAAAGGDPRTRLERNVDAIEAAKAQVAQSGVDPADTDAFYKAVMLALQKQGLVAEAAAIAKEWNAEKRTAAKDKLGADKLSLEKEELERKKARDERSYRLGVQKVESAEALARARMASAKEIAEMKLSAEELKDGPFKTIDYGDRIEVINRFNEIVRSGPKALNPKDGEKDANAKRDAEQAYAEYLAGLQRQYDAAVQLHNHQGVEGITGRFARHVGTDGVAGQIATTVAGAASRAALALHEQVTGGTFLAGLAKLKQASKTGATGLGAVSEREGDKVQSDAAALNRAQEAADYRAQLAIYIREMEGFATRLASAAQQDKIAPKALAAKPLKGAPAAKPAAAPAAPAAPAGQVEKWTRDAQGNLKRVTQ